MKGEKSFWHTLKRPYIVLAPMADVTDVAFRTLFAKYGKPDVFWTEFVSADGLLSKGRSALTADLLFSEEQRPIVAQLFTATPEHLYQAGCYVKELGFDGLDINMGCPDRSVEKQGSGAQLIQTPETAKALITAAKRTGLPVSVKTRLGYGRQEWQTWLPVLLSTGIEALTVHLRTRNELSKVPAHWEVMKEIVKLRDHYAPDTTLIGNGDVVSVADAQAKAEETGCDGVMIGRGIFGNPLVFAGATQETIATEQRLTLLIEHTETFATLLPMKNFSIMKKHFKAYVQGFDGAKELRTELMEKGNSAEETVILLTSALERMKHTASTSRDATLQV